MTDGYQVYTAPGQAFAAHEMVDHGKGEYSRGAAHTNTAEVFFSQRKRSIDGAYHHVPERHRDRYLAGFDFRYSNRKVKDGERTIRAIRRTRASGYATAARRRISGRIRADRLGLVGPLLALGMLRRR